MFDCKSGYSSLTARFCCISSFAVLAACGGGETSRAASYSDFADEWGVIFDDPALDQPRNAPASLPARGVVTYNGAMSLLILDGSTQQADTNLFILGDMRVSANFGTDTITGDVVEMVDSDNDTYRGSFNIDADIFNGSSFDEAAIFGTIDGSIQNERTNGIYRLNGIDSDEASFAGDFYGPDQQIIYSVIRGELDTPQGTILIWDDESRGIPGGDAILVATK